MKTQSMLLSLLLSCDLPTIDAFTLGLLTNPEVIAVDQDSAAIRWGTQTLLAAAAQLKIDDPLIPVWKDLQANLIPYLVDEKTGFMIGKNTPQLRSHRHWSHLFMIFPYALLDVNGPDRPLIENLCPVLVVTRALPTRVAPLWPPASAMVSRRSPASTP